MKSREALLVAAAVAWSCPARAQDAHARATDSFAQGRTAYDRHDYAAAAAAFEAAAGFELKPESLLDAADAWRLAGQPVRAAEDCDRVLAMEGLAPAIRTYAGDTLSKLTSMTATIAVDGPATSLVAIDGTPAVAAPTRRRVLPGHHVVEVTGAAGAHLRKDADLSGGQTLDIALASSPAAGSSATSSDTPTAPVDAHVDGGHRGPPASTWVGFGVGAVGAGLATAFGIATLQAQHAFEGAPTSAAADTFYRDRLVTNVALSVAVVGVAAGLAVWWLSGNSAPASAWQPRGVASGSWAF